MSRSYDSIYKYEMTNEKTNDSAFSTIRVICNIHKRDNVEMAIGGSRRARSKEAAVGPILDPNYLTFLTLINIFQTGLA